MIAERQVPPSPNGRREIRVATRGRVAASAPCRILYDAVEAIRAARPAVAPRLIRQIGRGNGPTSWPIAPQRAPLIAGA